MPLRNRLGISEGESRPLRGAATQGKVSQRLGQLHLLDERVANELVDICSLRWLDLEAAVKEVLQRWGDGVRASRSVLCASDRHQQSELVLLEPGWLTDDHLVDRAAKTPHIREAARRRPIFLPDQLRRRPVWGVRVELRLSRR